MKKLSELGISTAPWRAKQDCGYDRESGDFDTYDAVCDAKGKVMVEWRNGETYGDVWPNSEQDASLIAAAPELYDAAERYVRFHEESCIHGNRTAGEIIADANKAFKDLKAALAKASGESEVA